MHINRNASENSVKYRQCLQREEHWDWIRNDLMYTQSIYLSSKLELFAQIVEVLHCQIGTN